MGQSGTPMALSDEKSLQIFEALSFTSKTAIFLRDIPVQIASRMKVRVAAYFTTSETLQKRKVYICVLPYTQNKGVF